MNTAHKQPVPTLLTPGQVETRAGTEPQDHANFYFFTPCAESDVSILGKLWNWKHQKNCTTAGRLAIGTFTHSMVVFKGSLAAELKLSETSARSSPEGQAYTFTQSGYTQKQTHAALESKQV